MKQINYKILQRDFAIVNITVGTTMLITLVVLLLQHLDMLPLFPCALRELFGIYCPGCGGTRAIRALFKGQFLHSLVCNPAIILGGLLILYYEVGVILTLIKKNGKRYFYHRRWPLYSYLVVVAAFAIIRDVLLVGYQIDMLEQWIL